MNRMGTKLKIQRVTETQNTRGDVVESWTTLDEVWASVIPGQVKEFYDSQASRVVTHAPYDIGFRYGSELSDLTEKDRAVVSSSTATVYDFTSVTNVDNRNIEFAVRALIRG